MNLSNQKEKAIWLAAGRSSTLTSDDVARMIFLEQKVQIEGAALAASQKVGYGIVNAPSAAIGNLQQIAGVPQIVCSYRIMTLTAPQASPLILEPSLDADAIIKRLMQPAAYNITEEYVFTVVRDFVENHPEAGLELIRHSLGNDQTPPSSLYYLTALLGYIENTEIRDACSALLSALRYNPNKVIRDGAEDGIDHLESA